MRHVHTRSRVQTRTKTPAAEGHSMGTVCAVMRRTQAQHRLGVCVLVALPQRLRVAPSACRRHEGQ
jgi:hypothetical protein